MTCRQETNYDRDKQGSRDDRQEWKRTRSINVATKHLAEMNASNIIYHWSGLQVILRCFSFVSSVLLFE